MTMFHKNFNFKTGMPKKAVAFAVKHKISLGQDGTSGLYYIVDHKNGTFLFRGQKLSELSFFPTQRSALVMMKRYLKKIGRK